MRRVSLQAKGLFKHTFPFGNFTDAHLDGRLALAIWLQLLSRAISFLSRLRCLMLDCLLFVSAAGALVLASMTLASVHMGKIMEVRQVTVAMLGLDKLNAWSAAHCSNDLFTSQC